MSLKIIIFIGKKCDKSEFECHNESVKQFIQLSKTSESLTETKISADATKPLLKEGKGHLFRIKKGTHYVWYVCTKHISTFIVNDWDLLTILQEGIELTDLIKYGYEGRYKLMLEREYV